MSSISENLKTIRAELAGVANGRNITIVAAAKNQPAERIQEAIQAGVKSFGNNYAQEGESLIKTLGNALQWHFIGHIQSRKVKYLVDYYCVQSLDRIDIAKMLNERLLALNRKMRVLVEINVGREPQKSGILPEALPSFLNGLKDLKALLPSGLMTMPPPLEPVESRRPHFAEVKRLYDDFAGQFPFDTLSMGTSEDYREAVSEGASMVRLGTILLGRRPAKEVVHGA